VTVRYLKGRLLVANPALPDPNFHRTVVLMLSHGSEGALGVVINRPSELSLAGPLPVCEPLAAEPGVVFVGGPVEPGAAICLAEVEGSSDDGERWQQVLGSVGTLDLSADEMMLRVQRLRVFAGYSGWGAGQLETELEAGAWFVADARPDDALSSAPARLWREVLHRQGGWLAGLANFPEDPSSN